ncbi:MAG: zinc metallopeptidase RseP, partial [Candidatus Aminicenantes bacterium]|nr:zinc metallopeptidase RseP [Candidatus Aminicenantes bacterium]
TESDKQTDIGYAGFNPQIFTQVRMVQSHSPAEAAGLEAGDVIRAIDGKPIFFTGFLEVVRGNPGKALLFTVDRAGRPLTFPVTPRLEGKIGWIGIQHGAQP